MASLGVSRFTIGRVLNHVEESVTVGRGGEADTRGFANRRSRLGVAAPGPVRQPARPDCSFMALRTSVAASDSQTPVFGDFSRNRPPAGLLVDIGSAHCPGLAGGCDQLEFEPAGGGPAVRPESSRPSGFR